MTSPNTHIPNHENDITITEDMDGCMDGTDAYDIPDVFDIPDSHEGHHTHILPPAPVTTMPRTMERVVQPRTELPIGTKASAMKRLVENIPTNEYGLPDFIYRADLIVPDLYELDAHERTLCLDAATLELDYTQGFPTLPDGEPFWSQLPSEGTEAYRCFTQYLDLPRTRQPGQTYSAANAVRQVHALKEICGKSTVDLLTMAYLYYWPQRALAYDLFITVSHRKRREYMLQDVENEHLATSAKYIEQAQVFLDRVFADPDKHELKPREAMDLLVKMVQIQRISLGASPFGQKTSKDNDNVPANAPLEVILRTITQHAGLSGNKGNDTADITRQLFADPEALAQAQELIIRMGNARNPRDGQAVIAEGGHDIGGDRV